jgi:hypothetical protein
MTDHNITVSFIQPPIPNADHYIAYSADLGADCSPYGEGVDAASAIEDLLWQLEELVN